MKLRKHLAIGQKHSDVLSSIGSSLPHHSRCLLLFILRSVLSLFHSLFSRPHSS